MNDFDATTSRTSGDATTGRASWQLLSAPRDELREIAKRLWRRRWLIIAITVLGAVLSAVWVLQITPKYTSSAQLLIDPRGPRAFQTDTPVMPGMVMDRETIESEIQLLASRRLVGNLVDKLRLIEDPEFNPTLPDESSEIGAMLAGLIAPIGDWLRSLTRMTGDGMATRLDANMVARSRTVDEVAEALAVVRVGQSRVLSVTFTSRDPIRAAELANTMAELYLVDHLDNRVAQRRRVTTWLETRLTELRDAAIASERAADEYRRQTGLFEVKTASGTTERLDTQQLTQLSAELIKAQTDRVTLEAKLRDAEAGRGPSGYEAIPEVLSSPVIGSLRTQEVRVKQRIADSELEYGQRHPVLVSARGELADIQTNIRREVNKIIEGLRNEVGRARVREASVQNSLRQLERRTAEQNAAQVRMNELVREAEASQRILEQFLEETKSLSAKQALDEPEARIIANAEPPLLPSFPKKKVLVALAMIGSFLLACGLVVLLERLYSRFRTSDDVEDALNLPTLATVPAVQARKFRSAAAKASSMPARLLGDPPMEFRSALNSLHVAILSRGSAEIKGTTLFTSAFPGEGKSTMAAAFARRLADHEKRVVLVDCDVRRPSVARMLGLPAGPGVSEVLLGEATAADVVQQDPGSSLHVIAAGSAKNTAEILSQERLRPLLDHLCALYDAVVVDTGPVLLTPDAVLLCHHASRTVLVVRWNASNRQDVRRCVRMLAEARANVVGVVLNQVDVRKYASYAYDASNTYLRGYRKYYAR
jgi:capsular exopolysaccharide synthesis family protein